MLLSFRFANHRSFRDEQQLNLTPVYELPPEEAAEGHAALPVTGVFGANASGKSNLIDALAYVSRLVGRSDREVEPSVDIRRLGIKRNPFRLDPDQAGEPSSYVVDLLLQGVRYTYGFVLDDERIREEWLYSYPFNRQRTIFQRAVDEFKWGEESARELRKVADIVAPTALLLSAAARFGRPRLRRGQPVAEAYGPAHEVYLSLYFGIRESEARFRPYSDRGEWLLEPDRRTKVVELLRAADVGLRDIHVARLTESAQGESPNDAVPLSTNRFARPETQLQFIHSGAADSVVFDAVDESEGTLQLLRLARSAIAALEYGDVVLVDEVDASLHPLLTAKLIGLFRSELTNPRGAQLIFTSHDATLLGALDGEEVLRRDEIWFTEKDADGASSLYPLAEFKPRKEGENRQRRYLNGSYGAIPDLSMQMFEQALTARESAERDK
jgi:hypothetical protein